MSEFKGEGEAWVLGTQPQAGVCLHFSALPSPYGIGDIGDAAQAFLPQMVEMGLSVWQFLPTGPTAYGDSPYQPLSAFAGNEMLIGMEPLVRAGLLSQAELEALEGLDEASVDFARLIPSKHHLLRLAASRFDARAESSLKAEYDDFIEKHHKDWLADYALYRILKTQHDEKPWPQWSAEYARREPEALKRLAPQCEEELRYRQVVQFFFYQQWQALRQAAQEHHIRLFGDMPIYIALDSADAWASPGLLQVSPGGEPLRVAGVPPDYFSEDGQLWGNPLYDWEAHARSGYAWWTDRMCHAAAQYDLVRVDHFRGFESFWSVPFGAATARDGYWQRGPRDGLFLSLQNALGALPIVAENLGVITPEVEALRLRYRMPGMVVLQFEVNNPEFDLAAVDPNSVCYTGTHDNDTSLGWFSGGIGGGNNDTRSAAEVKTTQQNVLRLTGGTPATVHADLVRLAFSTPALLVVVPLQDYLGLGSESRFNVPGTTSNNWRWRLRPGQLDGLTRSRIRSWVLESRR
jgi:4-alpha-glucanotransferase